jgi:hypothetical protein
METHGGIMNVKLMVGTGLLGMALLCLGCRASADDSKPMKHVVVHTTLTGKDISRTTAAVSDVPHHEIAQRVYSYTLHSEDKDFDNMYTENFAQTDTTDGKGTHTGYAVWKNAQGDSIYSKFKGEHHPESGSAENADFSGEFDVFGGTGKFHDISGKGTYKGHITPSGQTSEVSLDARY